MPGMHLLTSILAELHTLRDLLMHKYGREYSQNVMDNKDGCVSERVRGSAAANHWEYAYLHYELTLADHKKACAHYATAWTGRPLFRGDREGLWRSMDTAGARFGRRKRGRCRRR
jgi:hypothetical protein